MATPSASLAATPVIPSLAVVFTIVTFFYVTSMNAQAGRKGRSLQFAHHTRVLDPTGRHQSAPGTVLTAVSDCTFPPNTRLLRVGFIDEQMGSGLKAVVALLTFARASNLTLVEPATGSAAANSNFHSMCPTSPAIARFQTLGSVYNLDRLALAGFRVLPLTAFWGLERCGVLPSRTVLPGSWDSNGTCFTCEGPAGNQTVFQHINAGRIHAGNRVMCGGKPEQNQWANIARGLGSSPAFLDACCVRKNDGASSGHFTNGISMRAQPAVPLEFSFPREYASRFIEEHGLADGFVGVHWRSEKDRGWLKQGVANTATRFIGMIRAALTAHNKTKIFVAVDFVGTGSTTHNPSPKLMVALNEVLDMVSAAFLTTRFIPDIDFPEAVAAQNNMLIAATEATILFRATQFVPLKRSGSFVNLILNERERHSLDPL